MNDQLKASDPEEMITCPYDKKHQVTRKRMAIHLDRCRKTYSEVSREMETCPFNFTHKLPKSEMDFHKSICPNRESLVLHSYVGETSEAVQRVVRNTERELIVPGNESWDIDQPVEPIVNSQEKLAEERGILRNHQNMPPAERKARREEDRLKMLERLNAEEQAKANLKNRASTSAASTSSVAPSTVRKAPICDAPSSSAMSVLSDSSFSTALDITTNRLGEFQLVQRKGRRRAAKIQTTVPSNSVAGVGRGRRLNN